MEVVSQITIQHVGKRTFF